MEITRETHTAQSLMDCAHQAPLPMGVSRQEYSSGCHALLQGIFPTRRSNSRLPASPALQADSLPTEPPEKPKTHVKYEQCASITQKCTLFTVLL